MTSSTPTSPLSRTPLVRQESLQGQHSKAMHPLRRTAPVPLAPMRTGPHHVFSFPAELN